MKARLRVAIPFIAVFWYLLVYHTPIANFLAALMICRALWEFFQMYQNQGHPSFAYRCLAFSLILYCLVIFYDFQHVEIAGLLGLFLLFVLQALDKDNHRGMEKISLTIFGWCYVIYCGVYFFRLQDLKFSGEAHGLWLLIALLFSSKLGDAFAYVGGKHFGKHKLIPRISPKKTWEGFFFGILGSLIPAFFLLSVPGFDLKLAVIVGLVVAIASFFGDLAESLLKREFNQKDAATDIPGFGGVLDIFDALLFALPSAYWTVILLHPAVSA